MIDDDEIDEVARMSEEQITLFLARSGISPADIERSWQKLEKRIEELLLAEASSNGKTPGFEPANGGSIPSASSGKAGK